jgi:hypothetical protein
MKTRLSLFLTLALPLASGAPRAHAGPIDSQEAALLLNLTAPDNDFYFLTLFAGYVPRQTVHYQATVTTTGWSATLSGTYAGQALAVAYSGDTTAFPGGTITWTSSGTYGAQSWSGSGSSFFSSINPPTLQFSIDSTLTVGGNNGVVHIVNQATASGSDFHDAGTTGTFLLNNNPLPGGKDTYWTGEKDGKSVSYNDHEVNGVIVTWSGPYPVTPPPKGEPFDLSGPMGTSCPEPSPLLLWGSGALGLLGGAWLRGRTQREVRNVAGATATRR